MSKCTVRSEMPRMRADACLLKNKGWMVIRYPTTFELKSVLRAAAQN